VTITTYGGKHGRMHKKTRHSIFPLSKSALISTRRVQMTFDRSSFALTSCSFVFLSLLALGTPVSSYGGTPHTCPGGTHQGASLGGGASKNFEFRKNCASETSLAVQWKFSIYNDATGQLISGCIWGPYTIGSTTQTKTCSSTPTRVRVVINYKTSSTGSWMTHTEWYTNP
jgi:hypothetical protein